MSSTDDPRRRVSKRSSGAEGGAPASPAEAARAARDDTAPGRGTIRGRVVTRDRQPVSGATVAVSGGPAHRDIAALTDPQGNFALSGLLPGEYCIAVHTDRGAQTKSAVVSAGQTGTVEFQFDV